MRKAMASAEVGDDVYGEDPTVNELEALAARMTGMESALFVASGTMGNIAAVLSHTNRGDEAILGADSHVMMSEAGGLAAVGGIMPKPLPTDFAGRMSIEDIENVISPDDEHYPRTALILVENSYGDKNGYPIEPAYFKKISDIGSRNDLRVHLDGARLFNASIALGVGAPEITQYVDSVSFCLSKALCAPVGSMLCGSEEFIYRARRMRKVLGGGMRQAGVLAAAGIIALAEMVDRLAVDHEHARNLAAGLTEIPGIELDIDLIKTNIVFFELDGKLPVDAFGLAKTLRNDANIWLGAVNERLIRVVTHYWVGEGEIDLLLQNMIRVLAK